MMKRILFALFFISLSVLTHAQNNIAVFHGAEARLKKYKALYVINQPDDKKIRMTLKNIRNAFEDPRLKGKLQIELIVFGDGTEVYKKANHYDTLLTELRRKGVILAQCENTMRERNISKDDLWPFISYVPSASGEIIIRQSQGWAIMHP